MSVSQSLDSLEAQPEAIVFPPSGLYSREPVLETYLVVPEKF